MPLGAMERAARTRTITVPIANYDKMSTPPMRILRLQNLWTESNDGCAARDEVARKHTIRQDKSFDSDPR